MAEQSAIRTVVWSEVLPWFMILRAVKLATSVPVLFVALVGCLLMPLGWWGARQLVPESAQASIAAQTDMGMLAVHGPDGVLAEYWEARHQVPQRDLVPAPVLDRTTLYQPMTSAFRVLVEPLRQLVRTGLSWPEIGFWLLVGLWHLLVWGLCGGVITRMAVVQYGRDQREGLLAAVRFVRRRYGAFVGTPLFALSGVLCALLLCIALSWFMQWELGTLLAGLLWVFVLIGGVTTTVFVLGVFWGWPLMWGALSAEEMGDVFEGAQRAYSYTFGRPWHYLGYGLLTVLVGSVVYHVVHYLAQLVVYFSYWAITWAGGATVLQATYHDGPGGIGGLLIAGLNTAVLLLGTAFCYSFLFTAAGVVYLLVRRDSDQIEWDVVHAPEQQPRFGLPPLETDAAGVPVVPQDSSPEDSAS